MKKNITKKNNRVKTLLKQEKDLNCIYKKQKILI